MYSTRTTPRAFTHSIENIPFAEIATAYDNLNRQAYGEWVIEQQQHNEYRKEKFLKNWAAEHEAPFEGDIEEEMSFSMDKSKYPGMSAQYKDEFSIYMDSFATKHKMQANAEWIFSQILAKFSTLPLVEYEDDTISASELFKEIRKSPFLSGMLLVCKHSTRSTFIKGQTDEKYKNFSSLVPLVMSAFKKYKNIPYSRWDKDEIQYITEAKLAKVMKMETLPDITVDEVLEARLAGLTIKSGNKMGELRPLKSTFTLYIPAGTALDGLEMLAKIMICQTWVAHPSTRTEYMILNPIDWDNMPDPLIGSAVMLKNAVATIRFSPPDTDLGAIPW